jgi:hypothetical protein
MSEIDWTINQLLNNRAGGVGSPGPSDLDAVRRAAADLKQAAFQIPAPNEVTPQLVQIAQLVETICDEADRKRTKR